MSPVAESAAVSEPTATAVTPTTAEAPPRPVLVGTTTALRLIARARG